MNCGLPEVSGLHDASDSPSAEISRLLNPTLSDDKNDQMSSDIGLDFGESSKFDPDSVLGSSYSLGREGDETDDLDLSITPNFETGLSCSPPSCFDSVSTSSSSTATVPSPSLSRCITSSGIPTMTAVSSGGSNPGPILGQLGTGTVVIGNVTAESLVSAVLNAKKSDVSDPGMNSVSVTPAAAGIWVLNTPPININPDILNLVKTVTLTSTVQTTGTMTAQDVCKSLTSHSVDSSKSLPFTVAPEPAAQAQANTSQGNTFLRKEVTKKEVISLSVSSSSSATVTKESTINVKESVGSACALQDGTHVVLKPQDTREANPTSFLRLEDILMKHNPVTGIHSELPKVTGTDLTDKDSSKKLLSKLEGSESNSFSELFSFQDLASNADVTPTKHLSDCLPLANMTTLAPDQPILQCSSSEEFQDVEEKCVTRDTSQPEPPPAKPISRPVEAKKFTAPTLIIEGLQEDSKLVKSLPSHKVPILPKDSEGQKNLQELKVTMPVTCEEKSTPVLVHLIRNSDFSNKDILYCQNIQTTLTEDLGQEMMDADLESSDEDMGKTEDDTRGAGAPPSVPQLAEVVPTHVQPRKKYQRHSEKNKVFKCDLCSAKFDIIGNYSRHRKIHKIDSENSQYKCGICDRSFLQRCDMKRHMLIHTKQEPHRCPTCGKGYIRKSDLVVHMRFHNKERPYKCTECEKEYYQSGDLKRHIRMSHTKEKMLSCGHCQRQYASETTLIRHMQTQHKDIILKSLNQKLSEGSTKEPKVTT